MRSYWTAALAGLLAFPGLCYAQVGGNAGFAQNGGKGRKRFRMSEASMC